MYYEERKEEIKTISPRLFLLELSDADVKRLYEKAGSAGLTPERLLENFIGDLVDGTYSNGSDERMLAGEWFGRCDFSYCYCNNFCAYLLKEDEMEYFNELYDTILECDDEICTAESVDEASYLARCIIEADSELHGLFDDYCRQNSTHGSFDDEIATVIEYRCGLEAALSHGAESSDDVSE